MATPYDRVYSAFLSKILEDEWGAWLKEEIELDWYMLLEGAIPWFKFPRTPLDRDKYGFVEDLSSEEIQILATYMKCEWLNRCIMTWENIKPLYEERDFSQANLLDKLVNTLKAERANALALESVYYRSIKGKPFLYRKMATSGFDLGGKHSMGQAHQCGVHGGPPPMYPPQKEPSKEPPKHDRPHEKPEHSDSDCHKHGHDDNHGGHNLTGRDEHGKHHDSKKEVKPHDE